MGKPLVHANFVSAFDPGHVFRSKAAGKMEVSRYQMGELVLPTGAIVACDPFVDVAQARPFVRTVAPGSYETILSLVQLSNRDVRVACAMIQFVAREPSRWELADVESDDPATHGVGYGVDSGTGCFLDASARSALASPKLQEALKADRLKPKYGSHGSALVLDPATRAEVFAFTAGWGDGSYASWWGTNARGQILALVTDFGLLTEPIMESLVFEIDSLAVGRIQHPELEATGDIVEVLRLDTQTGELEYLVGGEGKNLVEVDFVSRAGDRLKAPSTATETTRDGHDFWHKKLALGAKLPPTARVRINYSKGMRAL